MIATLGMGRRALASHGLAASSHLGPASVTSGVGALTLRQDLVITLFLLFFALLGFAAAFSVFYDFVVHTTLLVLVENKDNYSEGKALGMVAGLASVVGMAVFVMTTRYGAILSAHTRNETFRLLGLLFAVIGVYSVFLVGDAAVRVPLDRAAKSSEDVRALLQDLSIVPL